MLIDPYNNTYNYTLNGIEHEIILNHNIKIEQKPINEKILVSNKYLLKYIHDLFQYNSIEYCLINHILLGSYVFKGINIFNSTIELCTLDSNFIKLKKLKDDIIKDGFNIDISTNYIKIYTVFYDKKVSAYIYPLENEINENKLVYKNYNNKIFEHDFYDIYPIKNIDFEDFEISVPNKIEKVLVKFGFNLNYIYFTKNKYHNQNIIEEIEKKSIFNDIKDNIKDNINSFISVIKPFIFNE